MIGSHLGTLRSRPDQLGLSRFFGNFSAGFALSSRPPTSLLEKVTYVQKADKRRRKLKKIRTGFKRFIAFIFSQIGLSVLVVGYTVLGGLIFRAVELEHEKMVKLKGKEMRDGLADKFSTEILRQLRYHLFAYDTQTHSYYKLPKRGTSPASNETGLQSTEAKVTLNGLRPPSSTSYHRVRRSYQKSQFERTRRWLSVIDYTLRRKMRQELHSSLRKLVKLMEQEGWNGEDSPDDLKWSWEGSILFAVTVITTIGYGHAVPKTNIGKLLTIGYALIGIPLVFLYLTNIGDYLATLFRTLYAKICRRCCEGNCMKRSQLKHSATPLVIWNAQSAELEDEGKYDHRKPDPLLRSNLRVLNRIGAAQVHAKEKKGCNAEKINCPILVADGSIYREVTKDRISKEDAVSEQNSNTELGNDISTQAHACESKMDNTLCVWNGDSNSSSLFTARTTSNGKPIRGQQLTADLELHNNATQTILHADPSDELTSKSLLKSFATGRYLLCYQRERRLHKKRSRRKTLNQAENARTRRHLSPNYGATIFPSSGDTLDGQPSIPLNTSCPTFNIHTEQTDKKPAKVLTYPDFADYSPGSSQGLRKLHSSFPNDNDAFLELNQVSTSSPYIGNMSNLSSKNITCPIDLNNKKPTGSRPMVHSSIRKLKMYAKGSSSPQDNQTKKIEEENRRCSNDLYRSRLSMLASAASSTSDLRLQVSYYSRDSLQSLRWSDAEVLNSKTTALSHEDISNVTVPISLSICIMTTYILIGAIVFCIWEDDNYLKWSYFCFVTLSTIGFGDIVPGTKVDSTNPQEKLIIISLYVAIGLSVFAMCFKLMQEEVVSKCKWLGHKIGLLKHRVKKQKFSLPQPRDDVTPTHV